METILRATESGLSVAFNTHICFQTTYMWFEKAGFSCLFFGLFIYLFNEMIKAISAVEENLKIREVYAKSIC